MQDEDFALAEKFVGHSDVIKSLANEFKRIRSAAVEAERETCAQIAERFYECRSLDPAGTIAAAIRARSVCS